MCVISSDGIEIIVFARDTQAFLGINGTGVGAGFGAQEDVFKLDHAGVGKQQGAVATRNERGAGHHCVPTLSKEIDKRLTNLVSA